MKRALGVALPWIVGLGCGAGFLALTVAKLDQQSLADVWSSVRLYWVLPAILAFAASLAVRVVRWRELLRPMRGLQLAQVTEPLLIGYALNNIFPARLGELFRAHYARHSFGLSRSAVLGTIVIERVFDLLTIVLLLGVGITATLSVQDAAESILWTLLTSAIYVLALIAVFATSLWLMLRSGVMARFPGINRRATDFSVGLRAIIGSSAILVVSVSLLLWFLETAALWSMLAATGIHLSPGEVALVMGCVSLSTLIPSAPGFIGTFQFAFYVALTLIDYDGAHGVIAATLTQLFLFLPATVFGVLLASRSGIRIFRGKLSLES